MAISSTQLHPPRSRSEGRAAGVDSAHFFEHRILLRAFILNSQPLRASTWRAKFFCFFFPASFAAAAFAFALAAAALSAAASSAAAFGTAAFSARAYPPEKLDAIFDMKTRVCACILEDEGGNEYTMPHRKKK